MVTKAIFLDRDGVVNKDHGYISKSRDFDFSDGLFDVLRTLQKYGYAVIIVTNQSGIGRGFYTEEDYQKLTEWMLARFADEGIEIKGVYHCPHSPESGCTCRKPEPGLFLKAMEDIDVIPEKSWMVGDKDSDMLAAERAGIAHRVLLGFGHSIHSSYAITSLSELPELIEQTEQQN